jgi:hypothetical protein
MRTRLVVGRKLGSGSQPVWMVTAQDKVGTGS